MRVHVSCIRVCIFPAAKYQCQSSIYVSSFHPARGWNPKSV